MKIYRFRTTISTAGGSGSANTNPVIGGLCRQVYIRAQTSGALFRANIQSAYADTMRAYQLHTSTIMDDNRVLPMAGVYTVQITGASADGDFTTELLVQE